MKPEMPAAQAALEQAERIVDIRRRAVDAIIKARGKARTAMERRVSDLPRLLSRALAPDVGRASGLGKYEAELTGAREAGAYLRDLYGREEAAGAELTKAAEISSAASAEVARLKAAANAERQAQAQERRDRKTTAAEEAERRRLAKRPQEELDAERALEDARALAEGGFPAWRAAS